MTCSKLNTCGTCLHWHALKGQVAGQCRREPPRLQAPAGEYDHRGDLERTRWPLTLAAEWCGKYEKGVHGGE